MVDLDLLVSTPLHILLVNTASGRISIVRAGDGYYFGITKKDNVAVLSHSGGYLQYFQKGASPILTHNHLIQPHQIEWIEDKVLVANTGKNCISVFDGKGALCRDVYLNQIKSDNKEKNRLGNHFNSVHRIGDHIYVVAHNYERPSEVYKLSWPDLQVADVIVSKASWAHNIWSCEWGLVICDTKSGSLYELKSGEPIWQANEDGALTRGLAASEDYIFVGYSTHNQRKERNWKTGGIWIIDRKSLKTIDKLNMPGSGDVHEIRIIGVIDEGHNNQVFSKKDVSSLAQVSPLIASAYQLRRRFPMFQRDFPPISIPVRATQMIARWRKQIIQKRQILV